jgi:hypothetical protein
MSENLAMKGLDLCEQYFQAVGLPMLRRDFSKDIDRIAAGLVGDGSECFGFDDEISRDHDWGPGFCVWLESEDYERIGPQLQAALDALPPDFLGYGPRRSSRWGTDRIGVFETSRFYERFTGMKDLPRDLNDWLWLPENSLAACTNGKVFWDPLGEFTRRRNALLAFYPEDVRLKKIASRCMTIGQAGQYNLPRCLRRGEWFALQYAETKFCADVISLVFLLNRKFTPFYKWMHRAVKDLPILGLWAHGRIGDLIALSRPADKVDLIEAMCVGLIEELKRQGLTDHPGSFMADHGPEIVRRIGDERLRTLDVWIG